MAGPAQERHHRLDAVSDSGEQLVFWLEASPATGRLRCGFASLPHGVHADDAPRYPHNIRDAAPELRDALADEVSSRLALAFAAALSKAGEGLAAQKLLGKTQSVRIAYWNWTSNIRRSTSSSSDMRKISFRISAATMTLAGVLGRE